MSVGQSQKMTVSLLTVASVSVVICVCVAFGSIGCIRACAPSVCVLLKLLAAGCG